MQTFVNIDAFFCLFAGRARLTLLFTSCQIHQLQLADCHVHRVTQILRLDGDCKDAMTT